jgi:LPS export ABC transporter protein LptC
MSGGLSNENISDPALHNPFPAIFILVLPVLLIAVSCSKAPQPNQALVVREDDPVMSARNIDVLFSDSGKVQARLVSSLMSRYKGEDAYLDFPKGFKVFIFDSVQQVSTTITGDRGKRNENTRIMEAWGHVVVRNEKKNEQLNTEHLVWEESRHRIWTDVEVKITRPDQVLFGDRMESNEAFTRYTIDGIRGEFNVKKDSI